MLPWWLAPGAHPHPVLCGFAGAARRPQKRSEQTSIHFEKAAIVFNLGAVQARQPPVVALLLAAVLHGMPAQQASPSAAAATSVACARFMLPCSLLHPLPCPAPRPAAEPAGAAVRPQDRRRAEGERQVLPGAACSWVQVGRAAYQKLPRVLWLAGWLGWDGMQAVAGAVLLLFLCSTPIVQLHHLHAHSPRTASLAVQESAGTFAHLRDAASLKVEQPRPLDLTPEAAAMLEKLMLAQAQVGSQLGCASCVCHVCVMCVSCVRHWGGGEQRVALPAWLRACGGCSASGIRHPGGSRCARGPPQPALPLHLPCTHPHPHPGQPWIPPHPALPGRSAFWRRRSRTRRRLGWWRAWPSRPPSSTASAPPCSAPRRSARWGVRQGAQGAGQGVRLGGWPGATRVHAAGVAQAGAGGLEGARVSR